MIQKYRLYLSKDLTIIPSLKQLENATYLGTIEMDAEDMAILCDFMQIASDATVNSIADKISWLQSTQKPNDRSN